MKTKSKEEYNRLIADQEHPFNDRTELCGVTFSDQKGGSTICNEYKLVDGVPTLHKTYSF